MPETPFTATYDANNRMLTYNGQPLTYDANGNLTSRQTAQGLISYTWDAQDRLTAISGPNGTASFKYDYQGRRIEKIVNGTSTAFLYDGPQAIAEFQGSSIGTTYLTGLQIDEVLARYSASGNRTLLADALGSILAQSDDSQTSTSLYAYSPFGKVTEAGENDNALQYTGRENDGTGLYYYRARYYDPALKRFISSDPIGLLGGLNTYLYAYASPQRFIDPFGLVTFSGGVGGSFQVGGAGASMSGTIGFDTSGQICGQFTTCGRIGPGASGGATFNASVGEGNFCEGNSVSGGVFVEGGAGPFGGGSVDFGSEGVSGTLNFKGGVGGGAAGGAQICITRTKCF